MSEKSAEILTPFGEYQTPVQPQSVIDLLRDMLEAAERGEIAAVAMVVINPEGFQQPAIAIGTRGFPEIIGAVATLQHDAIEEWRKP